MQKLIFLNSVYDRTQNSFNDIRFILAFSVLFFHSYEMLPIKSTDFFTAAMNGQSSLGGLAVYGFFILSGFFMIQSLNNSNSVLNYFINRVLRILPAFWFPLLLFSLIIIPMISDINFRGENSALNFVWKSGTFHLFGYAWEINNAFPNNHLPNNINGSMWTLKHEIACYFMLPIIWYFCYKKRNFLLIFTFLFLVLAILSITSGFSIWHIPVGLAWVLSINEYPSFILFAYYFMSGVLIYLYRDKVIISKRLLILCFVLLIISANYGGLKYVFMLTLPYIFVVLGCLIKTTIFSKYGDFSYGMYIYAFPIQQIIISKSEEITVMELIFYSTILTVILSIFSWFFIERPILNFKHKK